ncbi:MBOAT family O-acyltransferase [Reyranella sp.]|uniref:MBOAT family O-acyltransferase n=1 Tax=Reyranella sp. TaxID=1929291 RepID=UPI003BAD12FC
MYFLATFYALVAAGFAATHLLPPEAIRGRAGALALIGIAGIVGLLDLPATSLAALAVCVVAVPIGCRIVAARGTTATMGLLFLAAGPLLLSWFVGKLATANGWSRLTPLLFVGASYMLVKTWSLLKDIRDGKTRSPDPVEVLAYLLHLPTFLVGPMHYFSEFQAELRKPYRIDGEAAVDIAFRLTLGIVKIFGISGLLAPASLLALDPAAPVSPLELLWAAIVYGVVLYCDFSGHCDLAIACSRLMGVNVPENFNWPYAAASIREFWRRWHITFSRALTAHVFVPVVRVLQKAWPHSPGTVSVVGYAATFLLCGFWHGATANFLLWGLWHAMGLAAQDAWMRFQRGRGVRPTGRKSRPQQALGIAATFLFVSVGWIFFVLPIDRLATILRLP